MTVQQPYALQNSSHPASLFRSAVHSPWRGPGVVAPGEYAVAAQSTPNMSVQVAGGRAWMLGTQVSNVSGQSFSTQSSYFGLNDAPVTVTIATANATNPRIDLVYVAVNDSFYSGTNNNAVIGVVTGTPAPSPVAPAAPSNSLTLATVAVAANATSITNSNISNTATATLLAIARGGIDPVLSTDSTAGTYGGQYRDHPTKGLQRWDGSSTWADPLTLAHPRVTTQATAVQSVPSGIATAVTFGTTTSRSTAAMWASGSPTRLVAPVTGEYDLSTLITWAPNATGQRTVSYRINGGATYNYFGTRYAGAATYGGEQSETVKGITLNAGDYLEIYVLQSSGGALNIANGGGDTATATLELARY